MKIMREQVGNHVNERLAPRSVQEAMAMQMFECVNPKPFSRWEVVEFEVREAYMQLANAAYYAAQKWKRDQRASRRESVVKPGEG